MKIAAIIVEYNPFHNGHLYHLEQTRKHTGADHIVCVMSGNFVQRGLPAIADKWHRAQMALACGADLVIELPCLYAIQSAEGFAQGAIRLVDSLQCVDTLSFGSECNDMAILQKYARLFAEEPASFKRNLQKHLQTGMSYPAARQAAIRQTEYNCDSDEILTGANNILAIEYLKALYVCDSNIQPFCIQRKGDGYSETTMSNAFSSATAIRNEIATNGFSQKVLSNIPKPCHPLLDFDPLCNLHHYFLLLQYKLRMMKPAEMSAIYDMSEGLQNRMKRVASTASTFEELVLSIKTKRYTYTRICRVLLYCLLDVTKQTIQMANSQTPLYAHVLGFRKNKTELLSYITQHSVIPVITRSSELTDNPLLRHDLLATDLYSLLNDPILPSNRDYTQKLVVI